MVRKAYESYDGSQVTDAMLEEAAKIFSEHYGTWNEHAAGVHGKFAKAGSRVKLNKDRLRADYLFDDTLCAYVRVFVDGQLAGNAFACRWMADGRSICWITQLVVHRDFRERGLASGLLSEIRRDTDDVFGLMSSHPAACLAAANAFARGGLGSIRHEFIRDHAASIMQASPVRYVRDAKLRGNVFEPNANQDLVCCADTGFQVDHTEPLAILAWVRDTMDCWPFGDLLDGHEFLYMQEVDGRSRAKSRRAS